MEALTDASASLIKSREAWDLFHERVGACTAHLSTIASLMGQARQEPGAAPKVPPVVVSSLQDNLESLSRLQEESRLRSAAAALMASDVQKVSMAVGGGAGATGGHGDDEEEEGDDAPQAAFLKSGGVVALHAKEKSKVEAQVAALNVQGLRRWKEVMEAMGEGGGDDDVEVEMDADAAAPSTKCPVTGMDMVNPLRRYVTMAFGCEAGGRGRRLYFWSTHLSRFSLACPTRSDIPFAFFMVLGLVALALVWFCRAPP